MTTGAETIPPAMTPEEWAAKRISYGNGLVANEQDCAGYGYHVDGDGDLYYEIGYEGCDRTEGIDRRHAMAALALYGQPFGFTHEDVDGLREVAGWLMDINYHDADPEGAALCRSLADRIIALLPPK